MLFVLSNVQDQGVVRSGSGRLFFIAMGIGIRACHNITTHPLVSVTSLAALGGLLLRNLSLLGGIRVGVLLLALALALPTCWELANILPLPLHTPVWSLSLTLLGRDTIARSRLLLLLRISPTIRLRVNIGRHTVALLGSAIGGRRTASVRRASETTTSTAVASAAASAATAPRASVRGLVNADGASVKPSHTVRGRCVLGSRGSGSYSTLFIADMAFWASSSLVYRTKPKPRLRPVSRSLTTT